MMFTPQAAERPMSRVAVEDHWVHCEPGTLQLLPREYQTLPVRVLQDLRDDAH